MGYPNRDSAPHGAKMMVRGILGFCEFARALVEMGYLNEGKKGWLVEKKEWVCREVVNVVVGADDSSERYVVSYPK